MIASAASLESREAASMPRRAVLFAIFVEAARTAHFGVEVIPQLFRFENALDIHLGRSASGRRLNGKCRQPEPTLNEIAAQVNVLDASIREMDLMPKKNSP